MSVPYLFRSFAGIGQSTPLALKRWDPDRNLPGMGLWCMDKLYDSSGGLVDFYIDVPRLFISSGQIMITHKGTDIPPHGGSYPVYANARLTLIGPYATKAEMPALNWDTPDPTVMVNGHNINGVVQHYATPSLDYKTILQPGYYRTCVYASAGTDASDVDGLAELGTYSQNLIHQFQVEVR